VGGGAWPFLVGGAICLVNSDNERDSSLLNRWRVLSLKNFGFEVRRESGWLRPGVPASYSAGFGSSGAGLKAFECCRSPGGRLRSRVRHNSS
jgi:hypothetical protein